MDDMNINLVRYIILIECFDDLANTIYMWYSAVWLHCCEAIRYSSARSWAAEGFSAHKSLSLAVYLRIVRLLLQILTNNGGLLLTCRVFFISRAACRHPQVVITFMNQQGRPVLNWSAGISTDIDRFMHCGSSPEKMVHHSNNDCAMLHSKFQSGEVIWKLVVTGWPLDDVKPSSKFVKFNIIITSLPCQWKLYSK